MCLTNRHRNCKPYVAHRIGEILASANIENWIWISTGDNVEDDATRCYDNIDLHKSSRWLNGLKFKKTT